ncbi:hypothetical protein [Bacillus thuringiensis]|uniref:hypothetical protein n=1 Tax=Bacillus thuringiensis TaxID=1428 RepID=UPI001112AB2F|nr:hypothetical protein [Bacillus thuringiensis]QCY65018.1 hypothetical protein FHE73_30655 [Bacillus thuringiensis]
MDGKRLWTILRGIAWANVGFGVLGFLYGLSLTVSTSETYSTYTEPHPDHWVSAFTLLLAGLMASLVFFFLERVLENSAMKEVILRDMLKKIESLEIKAKY